MPPNSLRRFHANRCCGTYIRYYCSLNVVMRLASAGRQCARNSNLQYIAIHNGIVTRIGTLDMAVTSMRRAGGKLAPRYEHSVRSASSSHCNRTSRSCAIPTHSHYNAIFHSRHGAMQAFFRPKARADNKWRPGDWSTVRTAWLVSLRDTKQLTAGKLQPPGTIILISELCINDR